MTDLANRSIFCVTKKIFNYSPLCSNYTHFWIFFFFFYTSGLFYSSTEIKHRKVEEPIFKPQILAIGWSFDKDFDAEEGETFM